MTDYNDGNWHGWNGGECPVHPQSVIEYAWRISTEWNNMTYVTIEKKSGVSKNSAIAIKWHQVIAFRVITPYQAPREFWAVGSQLFNSRVDAGEFRARLARDYPNNDYGDASRIIKLVEVKE